MQENASHQLAWMIQGYCVSQTIYIAAKLGIADQLASGPLPASELAARVGANPGALARLLRALVGIGIVAHHEPGQFELTSHGELLRDDAEGSLRSFAMLCGGELYRLWGEIEYCVRTGRSAADVVFGGNYFEHIGTDPAAAAIFNAGVISNVSPVVDALLAMSWDGVAHVVDVGGGNGYVLGGLLRRFTHLRGTLVDQAPAAAEARERFARDGLADRTVCVAGDFFTGVPEHGDVYLLTRVIHDWSDAEAIRILKNCRAAMPDGARIVIADAIDEPGRSAHWGDVNMLVITGGYERTRPQWDQLMAAADLRISSVESLERGDIILAQAA